MGVAAEVAEAADGRVGDPVPPPGALGRVAHGRVDDEADQPDGRGERKGRALAVGPRDVARARGRRDDREEDHGLDEGEIERRLPRVGAVVLRVREGREAQRLGLSLIHI